MQEPDYRRKDIWHKRFVLAVSIMLAITGWQQYEKTRKKEFQRAYYEERIRAINKVFEIVGRIDRAPTQAKKLEASREFWIIHHGYAIPYLTNKLFQELKPISNYINKCIQKYQRAAELEEDCSHSIVFYLPNFSSAAKEELSKSWDIDFDKISKDHPWHEM